MSTQPRRRTGLAQSVHRTHQELEALRSARHREFLVGRARAEFTLRVTRARGIDVEAASALRFVDGTAPIFRGSGSFRFGRNCSFRGGPVRGRLATAEGGKILFHDRVGFNYGLEIHSSELIEIGENTMGGALVTIYDTNFHQIDESTPVKTAPVRIGRNVWLARGCTVLPGVTIGDHAVISAGAVISRDVPARTLMAGNPAKPIRKLSASENWSRW